MAYFRALTARFIVRLVGDFLNEVAENHTAVFVKHNHAAGKKSGERAVDELHSIFLTEERRAECRPEHHIVNAF